MRLKWTSIRIDCWNDISWSQTYPLSVLSLYRGLWTGSTARNDDPETVARIPFDCESRPRQTARSRWFSRWNKRTDIFTAHHHHSLPSFVHASWCASLQYPLDSIREPDAVALASAECLFCWSSCRPRLDRRRRQGSSSCMARRCTVEECSKNGEIDVWFDRIARIESDDVEKVVPCVDTLIN